MTPSPTLFLSFFIVLLLSFEILLPLLMQPQNNFLDAPALSNFLSLWVLLPYIQHRAKVSCSAQAGKATDLLQHSWMQLTTCIKPVNKFSLNSFCKYPYMQDRSKCMIIHWAQKNQCQWLADFGKSTFFLPFFIKVPSETFVQSSFFITVSLQSWKHFVSVSSQFLMYEHLTGLSTHLLQQRKTVSSQGEICS